MRKNSHKVRRVLWFLPLFVACAWLLIPSSLTAGDGPVLGVRLADDSINPVTSEYITRAIDRAETERARCLVLQLDTPGGLLSSTRSIVRRMLMARVPLVVYISPGGARAGSAGVFITYASHVAAMAPSTNIGAAHPVQFGGGRKQDSARDWQALRQLIRDLQQEVREKRQAESGMDEGDEGVKEADGTGVQAAGKTGPDPDTGGATGLTPDENPMDTKILQDTVAFIRSIAQQRNRNVEWAVNSVVKSESITADEALSRGVVDIVAQDTAELLTRLNGRTVTVRGQPVVLDTGGQDVQWIEMDAKQRFFNVLANPNIAYFLMILGFYGLLYEVTHPGFGVPGILGATFLILAFYAMQYLPTNYAGLALIGLGVAFLITEAFSPGFGIFVTGGAVCMLLGSLLLFESADPVMRVSLSSVLAMTGTTVLIVLVLLNSAIRTLSIRVRGGQEGLIGQTAEVLSDIGPGQRGKVFVHGEIWNAESTDLVKKGDEVSVREVKGLLVKVQRKSKEEA